MLMTCTDSSGGRQWERLLTCTSTGSRAPTLQLGQPEFTFLISLWLPHAHYAARQKRCHLQLPEETFEESVKHIPDPILKSLPLDSPASDRTLLTRGALCRAHKMPLGCAMTSGHPNLHSTSSTFQQDRLTGAASPHLSELNKSKLSNSIMSIILFSVKTTKCAPLGFYFLLVLLNTH